VTSPPLAVSAACTLSKEKPIWRRSGTLTTDGAGAGAGDHDGNDDHQVGPKSR
jgi:hypothetical protein